MCFSDAVLGCTCDIDAPVLCATPVKFHNDTKKQKQNKFPDFKTLREFKSGMLLFDIKIYDKSIMG